MKIVLLSLLLLGIVSLSAQETERVVKAEVIVNAGIDKVWEAWTTEAGVKTFFAPAGKIELRVSGAYEIYFNPENAPGERGAEDCMILALQPPTMLAFTWSAPPHLPNVRRQRTSVVVRFKELEKGRTQVTLIESGWGEGEEWDKAFAYFSSAWKDQVLPFLQYRFAVGPIAWNNPPKLK